VAVSLIAILEVVPGLVAQSDVIAAARVLIHRLITNSGVVAADFAVMKCIDAVSRVVSCSTMASRSPDGAADPPSSATTTAELI